MSEVIRRVHKDNNEILSENIRLIIEMRALIPISRINTEIARISKAVRASEMAYCKAKGMEAPVANGYFRTSGPKFPVYGRTDLQAFNTFLLDAPEEHLSPNDSFAAYGCAFGGPSFNSKLYFHSVIGIDCDPKILEFARGNRDALGDNYRSVEFLNADFFKIDARGYNVIYVTWPSAALDPIEQLQSCLEKTKKGTKVIFSTHGSPSKYLHIFQESFQEITRGGSDFQRFLLYVRK